MTSVLKYLNKVKKGFSEKYFFHVRAEHFGHFETVIVYFETVQDDNKL